ncbi:MAG: adenosylcobinamide-GDP ribazoletransferase [Pseudonocardiales bacterium]|nr:MAG: adenosylcobinamide-GDP ribazoletransferase [Pseudonocardiales bacterium]
MSASADRGGLRLAVTMFTALPVPRSWHGDADRQRAARAVCWLPLLGAVLGALAGVPVAAVLARQPGAALLAAVLGIASLVLLSRGLHLDGLADTADALGSRAPAERALQIMRRSDIGPFGVLTLALVLSADIAALAYVVGDSTWRGCAALAVAAATGRVAITHAAWPGVPAARGSGFGALVAGGVRAPVACGLTVLVLGGGAVLAVAVGASPLGWPIAQAAALLAAAAVRVHTTRRLGGVTGDIFGALVECASALTLIGLALAG